MAFAQFPLQPKLQRQVDLLSVALLASINYNEDGQLLAPGAWRERSTLRDVFVVIM